MISKSKILSLAKRAVKSPGTYHAQWFITRKCNYRCRGCAVWMDQGSEELSTEDVKRGLDILRDIGVLEIVFSGGNPLLRDDMGEILEYASKYFITTVYDNGSIAAGKIEALRNVDFVAVSLDTLDEKKNDYIKGVNGAWRRAMETIEKLRDAGIHVGVSPTISQINLHEIIDFTKYFTERGIPVWYCLYTYDYQPNKGVFSIGRKNNEYEITDGKALAAVCDKLMEIKKENKYVYITGKTLRAVKQLALTGRRIWRCAALESFLVVDHEGRVSGCHCREPLFSIFDLPKVWGSGWIKGLRKEYSRCANCIYLCYIFYSVHRGLPGLLEIIFDQWGSIKDYMGK
ncbi:MAG: radical SAM protein [Candidatus Bathyarchaeota archaeon]|nr:radical SAM protein [Candidatus Bathyarchaeota archaeon]